MFASNCFSFPRFDSWSHLEVQRGQHPCQPHGGWPQRATDLPWGCSPRHPLVEVRRWEPSEKVLRVNIIIIIFIYFLGFCFMVYGLDVLVMVAIFVYSLSVCHFKMFHWCQVHDLGWWSQIANYLQRDIGINCISRLLSIVFCFICI